MGSLVLELSGLGAARSLKSELLVFDTKVKGFDRTLRVLIDSGASENFCRLATVRQCAAAWSSVIRSGETIAVRLATGVVMRSVAQYVELDLEFSDFKMRERFVVIDMDDRYDLILGIKWLRANEPWIDWKSGEVCCSLSARGESQSDEMFSERRSAWRNRLDGLRVRTHAHEMSLSHMGTISCTQSAALVALGGLSSGTVSCNGSADSSALGGMSSGTVLCNASAAKPASGGISSGTVSCIGSAERSASGGISSGTVSCIGLAAETAVGGRSSGTLPCTTELAGSPALGGQSSGAVSRNT